MKKYYKYGIDLGTTNSCIAKKREEDVKVFLNNKQMHVTPSAVYINSEGRKFVGFKAQNALKTDPKNVKTQFKRLMGNDINLLFDKSGEDMTPEELSAEVLKSLKDDVNRLDLEDEEMTGAVITVPASFDQSQCAATNKAASLAGLEDVLLLQEPIAAALAYGVRPETEEQNFIIFDLGGGTLDIAVVSIQNNRLEVLNHNGDNYLGGKDIDRNIVDELLLPKLQNDYNLPNDNSEEKKTLYNKLLFKAEEAKINLSNQEETIVDLFGLGEDKDGNPIDGTIKIKRNELEPLLEPVLKDSIPLLEKTINEIDFEYKDISKVLLVGGTTQIPKIREAIKEETELPLGCSLNPMTVVAKGAAIFASLNARKDIESPVEEEADQEKPVLKIEYDNITSEKKELVIGKFDDKWSDEIFEVRVSHTDGYWESGWLNLSEKDHFRTEVVLKENTKNEFKVKARDDKGTEIEIANNIFSIEHNKNHLSVSNEPLPKNISIEVETSEKEKLTKLAPVIEKGTPLPTEANIRVSASRKLIPKSGDKPLAVKVFEGDRYNHPQANNFIGVLKITSDRLSKPIRKDDEIEINLKISRSRIVYVSAKVIKSDLTTSKKIYIPDKPDKTSIINKMYALLDKCYEHIDEVESLAYQNKESDILKFNNLRQEVEDMDDLIEKDLEDKTTDEDRVLKLFSEIKKLYQRIIDFSDDLKEESGTEIEEIEEELQESLHKTDKLIEKFGDEEDKKELEQIKKDGKIYNRFDKRNEEQKRILERDIENLKKLYAQVLGKQYSLWENYFEDLKQGKYQFKNKEEARKWFKEGKKAKAMKDEDGLKRAVLNLLDNCKTERREIADKVEEMNELPGIKISDLLLLAESE